MITGNSENFIKSKLLDIVLNSKILSQVEIFHNTITLDIEMIIMKYVTATMKTD